MKTLIISGVYTPMQNGKVHYTIALYGQTESKPLVQYITGFAMELSGYDELQKMCRALYCEYFKTDLFNIISLENLNLNR